MKETETSPQEKLLLEMIAELRRRVTSQDETIEALKQELWTEKQYAESFRTHSQGRYNNWSRFHGDAK